MIRSMYFQRRASALDSATNPTGCQRVPRCYCLRIVPAPSTVAPISGPGEGVYPLTIHRGTGGDRIELLDGQVLYFAGGLKAGRGASLVAWVGNLPVGSSPDTWLMTWGDEAGDYIDPVSDGGAARRGKVLYDSGVVGFGAAIATPMLDLQGYDAVELIADNITGVGFRNLTMEGYSGNLSLGEILLRKVAWGAQENGASHAPGLVRGLISENPPGGTAGVHVLYDVTSAPNTAQDTGPLVTEDMDGVTVTAIKSAAVAAGSLGLIEVLDDGNYGASVTPSVGADAIPRAIGWGSGVGMTSGALILTGAQLPVPRRLRFTLSALGAGITGRLRVLGRGRIPGTFSVQMMLPTKAWFQLSADEIGDGRLVVIGR